MLCMVCCIVNMWSVNFIHYEGHVMEIMDTVGKLSLGLYISHKSYTALGEVRFPKTVYQMLFSEHEHLYSYTQ